MTQPKIPRLTGEQITLNELETQEGMTMKRFFALAAVYILVAPPVTGQARGQLSAQAAAELQNALQRGDVFAVLATVERECGQLLIESRASTKTVSERATKARDALQCAQSVSAGVFALASSDRALQVRELLNTGQSEYVVNLKQKESEEEFLGLRWGVGLGFSVAADANVDDADVVGGTVRVKSDQKDQPRALLEYHKYFWCNKGNTIGTRGCGPFVAAAATDGKVLSGVGLGLMFGMKAKDTESDGFSVGAGVVLDAKVKDLGVGFTANEAPPSGETSVRFITKSRWSTLLFVTRTF